MHRYTCIGSLVHWCCSKQRSEYEVLRSEYEVQRSEYEVLSTSVAKYAGCYARR
jgi:predicted metal-binding transcription factor (methanogenesis marker protein 9)